MSAWVPAAIYGLCLVASATCASVPMRGYLKSRTPLLLYSATCFVFLALNNLLVAIDLLLFPTKETPPPRASVRLLNKAVKECQYTSEAISLITAKSIVAGIVTTGCLIGALFFLRFWCRARDNLFSYFGASFLLFATNQALVVLSVTRERMNAFSIFCVLRVSRC